MPGRFVRNCTAAAWGLETYFLSSGIATPELQLNARELAYAWESLAQLGEMVDRRSALLNAAIAYELAGFQANAMCIARQLVPSVQTNLESDLGNLLGLFIQRRYVRLLQLCRQAQQEPLMTDQIDLETVVSGCTAMAAEGIQKCISFLMRGEIDSFEPAQELLQQSESFFSSASLPFQANTIRAFRSILPILQNRSTWTLMSDHWQTNPRWARYLKLLARGVGPRILQDRSISELWESQKFALARGLLKEDVNVIVRMPTSAGKTRIAELAITATLINHPGSKCIYVAPYRALVWEVQDGLIRLFGDMGYKVSSVIGGFETDDFEDFLFKGTDILILTPEKLDLLNRLQPEFLEQVRLFVLDEAQIVDDKQRGPKFELLLTRLKRKLKEARFIFLSAVFSEQTLQDFASWLNVQSSHVLISDWRPSIQRIAKFEWRGNSGVLVFSKEADIPGLNEFVPGVIRKLEYEYINPDTGRTRHVTFPSAINKSETAAELAIRHAEIGSVLVFCPQINFVESVVKAIQKAIKLRRLVNEEVPHFFELHETTRSAVTASEWLGDSHFVTIALRQGIGVHHGDLPEAVRKAVEQDFRANRFRVIVATNTLAQGVNLPIQTVIIHSCWRHQPDGTGERIPVRDYWNIAGRAGRAGVETHGTIIHITFTEQDERDFRHYTDRNNIEPVQGALFHMLKDLVEDRLSEESIKARLDAEVLAILVEEGLTGIELTQIDEILTKSLVHIQSDREKIDSNVLSRLMTDIATTTLARVTDPKYRELYATTGLSVSSCEVIREHVQTQESLLRSLLIEAGLKDLNDLANFFLNVSVTLPEMQSDCEFSGDYSELLMHWLLMKDQGLLSVQFKDQVTSPEELSKFIEDFFGYRLPWGISAVICIASAILEIDADQLSEYVKYFPSMVKYGVADPIACWAMSSGIPIRRVAMDLSNAFRSEIPVHEHGSFMEWLGSLEEERLREEFGLTGPILDEMRNVLSNAVPNKLVSEFPDAIQMLPVEAEVKGMSYGNRRLVAQQIQVGHSLVLERDYDNPIDRNAIKVVHKAGELGFIPRDMAQVLAPEIDTGLTLKAEVSSVVLGRVPKIKITIATAAS